MPPKDLSRECIRDTLMYKRDPDQWKDQRFRTLYSSAMQRLRIGQLVPHVEQRMQAGRYLNMQLDKRAASEIVIVVRDGCVDTVLSTNPYTKIMIADYGDPDMVCELDEAEESAHQPDMCIVYRKEKTPMNKPVDCTFVSVWSSGLKVVSPASIDLESGRVLHVQNTSLFGSMLATCQHLEKQYIIFNGCEYAVEREANNEYYALRTFGVFFTRCGYAQVKAKNAQEAMRIADLELKHDDISWDDEWHPTDAQLEDELHGK